MNFHSERSPATRATAPFNSRDANIILRSSDKVEFRVHRHIVALASPVLGELMSSAPRPPPSSSLSGRSHKVRPQVDLSEPSEVLDLFLRFVYPVPEPLLTLDDIDLLLQLAKKYGSASLESHMHAHLLRQDILDCDPWSVYRLASSAGMDDVVCIAARHTLPRPLPSSPQFSNESMAVLLRYRRKCVEAAVGVTRVDGSVPWWVKLQWRRLCFLSECYECAKMPRKTLQWKKLRYERLDVPVYWVNYMAAVGSALRRKLDPAVARDPSIVRPAVEEAMRCSRCAVKAFWDIQEFAGNLEDAIEEAISSVEFALRKSDGYGKDDARTLVSTTRTKYLLPCDKAVLPLFDYYLPVYRKRCGRPQENDSSSALGDDDDTLAPPSEC